MMRSSPLGKENNSSDEFDLSFMGRDKSKIPGKTPKKSMEASEILVRYAAGSGDMSCLSETREGANNELPSADDLSPPCPRRKDSEMKYSSLSPLDIRVPSAKTISDKCFQGVSSASSSSTESSIVKSCVDDDDSDEDYTLDETEASPESKAIMAEMEQVYESSPIPSSYLNSPPRQSQVMPEIVLSPKSLGKPKAMLAKKDVEAADLLAKRRGRRSTHNKNGTARPRGGGPSTTSFAATKAAYGGGSTRSKQHTSMPRQLSSANASCGKGRSNRRISQGREAFTAPNDFVGISKPLEWDMPTENPTAKRSSSRTKKKPTALAVQREKQQRKQRLKDAKTPSNEVDGRRNLDKRTARLRFAEDFNADIARHRQRLPYLNNGSNHSDKVGSQIQDRGINGVSIAVRKRPIFDYELDRGDYDIVSIDNTNGQGHDVTIVHNGVMHPDMKQMLMKPTNFPVTAAFDELASDDDIYRHIAAPLVLDAVNEGVATILMYGQTGCGKSHTMSGIETRMAQGLFQAIDAKLSDEVNDKPVVTIQFVELCGSKECRDLLVKKTRKAEVKLADDEDGSVRLLNAASCVVQSPEELQEKIMAAKGRRATEATDKNGVSSRSHAVCQIQIEGKRRGLLTLIDCAGSERRHDSMYHSSERQKESAEINASLYALKECIRARASKSSRIPFRSSSLTRILKESFERDGARLCVIACVAPNATDTEHTMETLKTVASIVGVDGQIVEEKAHAVTPKRVEARPAALPPKLWGHDHLKKFLSHKKMHKVQLSDKHDGKALMKMSVPQMRAQLFKDKDKELAHKLFDILRKENDRVAEIHRRERANLKEQRKGRV